MLQFTILIFYGFRLTKPHQKQSCPTHIIAMRKQDFNHFESYVLLQTLMNVLTDLTDVNSYVLTNQDTTVALVIKVIQGT